MADSREHPLAKAFVMGQKWYVCRWIDVDKASPGWDVGWLVPFVH